jgi:hypothetical protein
MGTVARNLRVGQGFEDAQEFFGVGRATRGLRDLVIQTRLEECEEQQQTLRGDGDDGDDEKGV